METDFYLTHPIHVNKIKREFDVYAEENKAVLENLILTVDKTIVGIKSAAVLPFLKEPQVVEVRIGAAPFPKKMDLKTAEDLYRILALYVSLEDY